MDGDGENLRLPSNSDAPTSAPPPTSGAITTNVPIAAPNSPPRNAHVNLNAAGGGALPVREQDRLMPIANVMRIMRKVLPEQVKISDEAKDTILECVSDYINFVTAEANERCQQDLRKTVTAEDVMWAMSELGFDDYVEPLAIYLRRYRESEGNPRADLLLPLKRSHSEAGSSGTAALSGVLPRPPPPPPPPVSAPNQIVQLPEQQFEDDPVGYYLNPAHGDEPGQGEAASSSGNPTDDGFNPDDFFN